VSLRADLNADGGRSASDPAAFFRTPEFLEAEGVTHTLAVHGAVPPLLLPVIVRPIEGSDRLDAISPYGYPGASVVPPAPPEPTDVNWSATGLVSLFVRDRIGGGTCFAGGTERAQVHIADPRLESGVRKRLREQIRRNERRGWRVGAEPGPQAEPEDVRAFELAYGETMARTGASGRYLYDSSYFASLLTSPTAWLLLAGLEGEEPGAGAIVVASDHHLHYFLGGTRDAALADSPMKNLFAAMTSLAGELGLRLHLGGGVEEGDSLDAFKRGFANAAESFVTHEIVCDGAAYEELSAGRPTAPDGFFPAYRAPG
jgi:hypothetical protein